MSEAGRALLSIWISTQAVQTHSGNVVRAEGSTHLQYNPGNIGVAQLRKKNIATELSTTPSQFSSYRNSIVDAVEKKWGGCLNSRSLLSYVLPDR